MAERCSYCGEVGHSIQQCPKWRTKEEVATASSQPTDLLGFIKKYSPPIEDTVFEEMKKIVVKHGVNYKKDLGFMEFPRPGVSDEKFKEIVADAERKLGELGYGYYDMFETTIVIDFPGEKKAYEEWEKAGHPHSSSSSPKRVYVNPAELPSPGAHSSAKKKYEVVYLDAAGRKHAEQIDDDIIFYQERVGPEGLMIISIHKIKSEESSNPKKIEFTDRGTRIT